jgi:hypothetical protein
MSDRDAPSATSAGQVTPSNDSTLVVTGGSKPGEDRIRERAHQLWEAADKPEGRDEEFWHQAVAEIAKQDEQLLNPKPPAPTTA